MCVEVDCLAAADFDYGGGGDGGAGGLQSVLTGLHNPVSRQSLLPACTSLYSTSPDSISPLPQSAMNPFFQLEE